MKQSKIVLPLAMGAAAVAGTSCDKAAKVAQKPNVIIIYTDDMGWTDISAYGGQFTPTNNIDRIGKEGIQFMQYYSACPISSPSRVGVTTGMYPTEWGITTFLNDRATNRKNSSNDYLLANAPTMARAFKSGGYNTAHIGKWHMGGGRDVKDMPQITAYGYDEYVSTWESPDPDPLITASNWIWCDNDSIKRWQRTEYFVDKVLDFLKRHKDEPCFVTLWPDDMHTPYVPSQEAYDRGNDGYWSKQINFTPVLAEFDKQIGRLMDGLDAMGLTDNTILIFTSDNGPNPSYKNARTGGLRGQKATLYEGGIRMPFLIRWPAKIKAGQINDETVLTSIDLFPTLCSMAGIKAESGEYTLDGLDFSKTLLGTKQNTKRKTPMFWEFGQHFFPGTITEKQYQTRSPHIAVRDGDWKFLVNSDGTYPELYNLAEDVYETTNLKDQEPELAAKYQKMCIEWFNENFRKHAGEITPLN